MKSDPGKTTNPSGETSPPGSAPDRCPHGTQPKIFCSNWMFGQCPVSCQHEGDTRKYAARTEAQKPADRSALLRIAAAMLHNENFPSVYPEDHPKRTPRRIIKAAEQAQAQLQRWAVELAAIAHIESPNEKLRDDDEQAG